MPAQNSKTFFDSTLADEVAADFFVSKLVADRIFEFFQKSPLFLWNDIHNCEDRAEAIAILLQHWGIPHYKAWVFSSYFLKNESGSLHNEWNYHVCPMLPVKEENSDLLEYYVIDPAHASSLQKIIIWANAVTKDDFSYHTIKNGYTYIFPTGPISQQNWHYRNKQNFKWTIQGLAGINGVSNSGKAAVAFKKYKIRSTLKSFTQLKNSKPDFGYYGE
ncbi:MAG: hypothetical protein K2Q21_11840 [Chitinophagaceae bacterium]|nr:hypothetical protein [Chitinophagaceae bacterium]